IRERRWVSSPVGRERITSSAREGAMLDPAQRFARSSWYLFPGPLAPTAEPIHTTGLRGITEYDFAVVADAILAVPGTRVVHPPEPGWTDWVARWESDGRYIEVDMFPDSEPFASESGQYFWSGGWLRVRE